MNMRNVMGVTSGEKVKIRIILFCIVIFCLSVKLPIIFTSTAKLFHAEETFTGVIAKELLLGPSQGIFEYQHPPIFGGVLFSGIITVPFFILFGDSIVSVKLVTFIYFISSLCLIFLLFKRFFNLKMAVIVSLLLTLSNSEFARRSLILIGNHCESIVFSLGMVYLLFRLCYDQDIENRNMLYSLLGLISGFGIYFNYMVLITLFICLLFLFIFDKLFFFRRSFIYFILAFIAGFSPWIYYNLTHGFRGTILMYEYPIVSYLSPDAFLRFPLNLKYYLFTHFPESLSFLGFSENSDKLFSRLYLLVFVFAFLSLCWINRLSLRKALLGIIPLRRFNASREDISKTTIILVYFLAYSLLYVLYIPQEKISRLCPLWPFIATIIAISIHEFWLRKNKPLAIAIAVITIGIGFITSLNLITLNNPYKDYREKGFSYFMFGFMRGISVSSGISSFNSNLRIAEDLKGEFKNEFLNGLVYMSVRDSFPTAETLSQVLLLIDRSEIKYKNEFYKSLGIGLGEGFSEHYNVSSLDLKVRENFKVVLKKIEDSKVNTDNFYYGIGFGAGKTYLDTKKNADLLVDYLGSFKQNYYQGLIDQITRGYVCYKNDIPRVIAEINKLDKKYRDHAYYKLGREIGLRFNGNAPWLSGKIIKQRSDCVSNLLYKYDTMSERISDNDYVSNYCEPLGWSLEGRMSINKLLAFIVDDEDRNNFINGLITAIDLRN